MSSLIDAQVQSVTPDQAALWLQNNLFQYQRKRRITHTRFLASEMAAGRFRPGTAIEFGVLDGKLFLVNGQHTLDAIQTNGSPVSLVIVRQAVKDEEELAHLYNTYDTGLSRTWTDAFAALNLNDRYQMTDREINALGWASPYIAGNFGHQAVMAATKDRSRDLRVAIMETFHAAAREYLDCLKTAEPPIRKALLQAPVFALGAFTVHYDHDRALRFWSLAADDERLAKTDPPKAATVLTQRVTKRSVKALVALAQSLVTVWNAFVLERDVKKPRLLTQPSDSVRILRTPLEDDSQGSMLPEIESDAALDNAVEQLDRIRTEGWSNHVAPAGEHRPQA